MKGLYKISTVAERSGFSATLLRAWERRHGFLEPERQPSGHRLYTDDDLRVLRVVRLMLDRGHAVGEIAALGREGLLQSTLALEPRSTPPNPPPANAELLFSSLRGEFVEAIQALDEERARALLKDFTSVTDDFTKIEGFSRELGDQVGEMWASGKLTVASEHLLSSLWKEYLHSLLASFKRSDSAGQHVVCAGMPDELHEVGLLFLCFELLRAGYRVTSLGPCLPLEDLESAILRLQPHGVCLSVTRGPVLQLHLPRLKEVVHRNPSVRFIVGGAGVAGLEDELLKLGVTGWQPNRPLTDLKKVLA